MVAHMPVYVELCESWNIHGHKHTVSGGNKTAHANKLHQRSQNFKLISTDLGGGESGSYSLYWNLDFFEKPCWLTNFFFFRLHCRKSILITYVDNITFCAWYLLQDSLCNRECTMVHKNLQDFSHLSHVRDFFYIFKFFVFPKKMHGRNRQSSILNVPEKVFDTTCLVCF